MIAITGANGLLGSYILRRLLHEGIPVIPLRRNSSTPIPEEFVSLTWRECEITDPLSIQAALAGVTVVIHTAALVSFNPRLRKKMLNINVTGTQNIVDACVSLKIPRLIHISSIAALGRKKGVALMDEETKWVDNDLNTDYAESKYLGELEVWRGAEEGLEVSVINPTVILAPADWSKSSARLFHYVWQEKKFFSRTLINYVDVRDVVDVIWKIYKGNYRGERFIVNGGNIAIQQLFAHIAVRFKKKAPGIEVNPTIIRILAVWEELRSRLTGSEPLITRQTAKITKESFHYDNQKAVRELGITYRKLDETLDWCCAQYLQAYTTNK